MVVKIVKCSQRHQSEHSVTQQVSFTRTELGQRRDHSTWFLQKPKQNNGLKKTRTKGSGLRHTCPSSKESDVETDVCPVSHRETQWYQPCMATAVSDGVHCRSPSPQAPLLQTEIGLSRLQLLGSMAGKGIQDCLLLAALPSKTQRPLPLGRGHSGSSWRQPLYQDCLLMEQT